MNPHLIPQPMTPDEIADLVARARASGIEARQYASRRATESIRARSAAGALVGRGHDPFSVGRRAASWAFRNRTKLCHAAAMFGCSATLVEKRWREMYPDVPAIVSRRPR